MSDEKMPNFGELGLSMQVLRVLDEVGYETPSPIQAMTIPIMLEGRDVLGQAQTGTGKTAAFAMPLLSRINIKQVEPSVLVLTPTRELAIQVAEAFQRYATYVDGFHVVPIYGGSDYRSQIRQLKRGVHVVVGTPGRVMDHMRKGTLRLDSLMTLVLDEADEMLRMGFIEDVQWILEQTPSDRQTALFSATMPAAVRKIAQSHLKNPKEISIKVKTTTAETIRQRFWMVSELNKLDALTRVLEFENFDGMLIFVRTKTQTVELADKLQARGFNAVPLNGDIPQNRREHTVSQLKKGEIDIIVATDVAARGLDVDRISHVINYDIPYDTESYIHRVGRTGRAGRSGDAILFVSPRERRLLQAIERATRQKIEMLEMPSTEVINNKRIDAFKQKITNTLALGDIAFFADLLEQYRQEHNVPALDIAAALAKMLQGDTPMLLPVKKKKSKHEQMEEADFSAFDKKASVNSKKGRMAGKETSVKDEVSFKKDVSAKSDDTGRKELLQKGLACYRIEAGKRQGIKPAKILDTIYAEIGLDREYIGRIEVNEDFSTVFLPKDMPRQFLRILNKAHINGHQMSLSKINGPERKHNDSAKFKGNFKGKSNGNLKSNKRRKY